MANIPKTNTTGISDAQGLLGKLFQYLMSLGGGTTQPPQVSMGGLPSTGDVELTRHSLNHAPMRAMAGGGADPSVDSRSMRSANWLGANQANAEVGDINRQAKLGIEGQNLGLMQSNLFNNQSMQAMIDSLLGGVSGGLGQIGTYPPNLRGQAQGVAASGTGGGGGLLGLFGL